MVRRFNLTACGIFSLRRAESFSPLESLTKSTVSLGSSLKTHKSRRKYWSARILVCRSRGVVPARTCARRSPNNVALSSRQKTRRSYFPARLSGQDSIEPVKHLLKKYLACTCLAVLASAFTRLKEHVFFRTL